MMVNNVPKFIFLIPFVIHTLNVKSEVYVDQLQKETYFELIIITIIIIIIIQSHAS